MSFWGAFFALLVLVTLVVTDTPARAAGPLGISPTSANVPPKGTQAFTGTGGTGPYSYALQTNASGGSVGATGLYTAGATGGVLDVVRVTDTGDPLTPFVDATVNVGPALTIAPSTLAIAPNASQDFTTNGGSGVIATWAVTTTTGGTISTAGHYTAGATPNSSDTVTATDTLGNVAHVNVSIGAGISINPASPSVAPKQQVSFAASGGTGGPYTWSLTTNGSGGNIVPGTGVYHAGATGSTSDVVKVLDGVGNTASVTVTVGPALSITPVNPSSAPRGTVGFSVLGGSGAGYTWSLSTNASSGSIGATSGTYTAGATPSVTDTVSVVDSLGNTTSTNVTVGPGISPSPAAPSVSPKQSVAFSATGGAGAPYTWAFVTNASGGSLTTAGAYTAGATGSKVDVISVTDGNLNTAQVSVTVGPGVAIAAASLSTPPLGTLTLTPSGGNGVYTWTIPTNNSGGTVVAGTYTAGATGATTDTVQLSDSLGNTTTVNISVGGGISINPSTPTSPPKGAVAFTVQGGSGAGYQWSITTNGSGGAIVAGTGAYTAGATPSTTDTVKVVDSLGNFGTANVTVGVGVAITPTSATVAPLGAKAFGAAGGSGQSFVWSFMTNASGGTLDAVTGAYKAGAAGNVTDVVKVTDSLGNVATANVGVGAPLALTPSSASVTPRGSKAFVATGGAGGYGFTLLTNASGGNVSGTTGAYTAGATGSVNDLLRVTDANGATASATIAVGPGITITPGSTPSPAPLDTVQFSAVGGSGAGYKWSLMTNASGGAMNATSGLYRAGPTGNVLDTVQVVDSLGNAATGNVAVGGALSIVPSQLVLPPRGTVTLAAAGGSGTGFKWTLDTAPSGATIDGTTGAYVAGPLGNVEDVVRVTDSEGRSSLARVDVGPAVSLAPDTATVAPRASVVFTAAGGSATGFTFAVITNASGGTIASDGTYTAGATGGGADVVEVTDSLGNRAEATVTVTAPPVAAAPDAGPAGEVVVSDPGAGCAVGPVGSDGDSSRYGGVLALGALVLLGRRRVRGGQRRRSTVPSTR